jgi:hypothetical protein
MHDGRAGIVGRGLFEFDLILGWFSIIGWFGGAVPVVVLLLAQQLRRVGGLGEDADGFGPAYIDGVGVALPPGEEVGDPIHSGFEPDGIPGGGAANDQLQTVLGAAAQPHEPFPGSGGGLLFGAGRVSLNDGCI